MKNGKENGNFVQKNVAAFLLDKPVWVWWIFYIAVTGVLFGVFSLVLYLLTIQWWVAVLLLLVTGISWSSIKYVSIHKKIGDEKKQAA